jgi:hypothetical protein
MEPEQEVRPWDRKEMPGQGHGARAATKFEMAVSGAAGHLSSTITILWVFFSTLSIVNTNVFIMLVMESLSSSSSSIKQKNHPSDF